MWSVEVPDPESPSLSNISVTVRGIIDGPGAGTGDEDRLMVLGRDSSSSLILILTSWSRRLMDFSLVILKSCGTTGLAVPLWLLVSSTTCVASSYKLCFIKYDNHSVLQVNLKVSALMVFRFRHQIRYSTFLILKCTLTIR